MRSQTEIRQQITDTIIEALTNGNLPPWRKPWAIRKCGDWCWETWTVGQPATN